MTDNLNLPSDTNDNKDKVAQKQQRKECNQLRKAKKVTS